MNQDAAEPEDALRKMKLGVVYILMVHLIMAGLGAIPAWESDVVGRHIATVALWSLVIVPFVLGALLLVSYATRQATYFLATGIAAQLTITFDVVLLGTLLLVAAGISGERIRGLLYGLLASHLLFIALLEWRVAPKVWSRSVASGRIDLEKAVLDPRIQFDSPSTKHSLLWQVLLAAGPAIGVFIANVLRFSAKGDITLLIGGCIVMPGSLLFTYVAWPFSVSVLIRVIHWQLRNRRIIRLPPAPPRTGWSEN